MPTKIEKDQVTGTLTTGHEWDGIKELNTPLPKWWLYGFFVCIAFSLGYYVFYPSFPGLSGYLPGILHNSQRVNVEQQIKAAEQAKAGFVDRIRAADLQTIAATADLREFAVAGGHSAFANNCAPCHGAGAQGSKGFPNLVDDVWLWGGAPEQIQATITHGIRNDDPDSHQSQMPRFGADGVLSAAQINDVADYVLSLTHRETDKAAAARGSALFADNCAVCHGDAGGGNQELGAPPLNTAIWLYGGDKATLIETITYARAGNMPAWGAKLDPAVIKMLTVYVHQLGGGK